MADLSSAIQTIREARTGREARRPIIDALLTLQEEGKNVSTLNYKPDTFYAKRTDLAQIMPVDETPKPYSKKLVQAKSVRYLIGLIEYADFDIHEEEDPWQI